MYSGRVAVDTVNQVKNSLKPAEVTKLLKDAQKHIGHQLKAAEDLRQDVDLSIVKAQIASKLWWLKLQEQN